MSENVRTRARTTRQAEGKPWAHVAEGFAVCLILLVAVAQAQTDCSQGNGPLDQAPPQGMSPQEVIVKFAAQEARVKQARTGYTYTQEVRVQTLAGTAVDGEYHEMSTVSYDKHGRRNETVTLAEQSTLRRAQLSARDMDDIRIFMPLILTTDDLPQYKLTYTGQQQVDDLHAYVFYVEPKKMEENKRYFQGRIWVDDHDLEIVKVCGKSVPEDTHVGKKQPQDLRPTFVSYRQPVDHYWFPAYVRVDDVLHFRNASVHLRETIKFTGYKRNDNVPPAP